MAGTPGMTQIRSVSITGLSVVTLTFADGDKISAPLKIEAMGTAMDHAGSDH